MLQSLERRKGLFRGYDQKLTGDVRRDIVHACERTVRQGRLRPREIDCRKFELRKLLETASRTYHVVASRLD